MWRAEIVGHSFDLEAAEDAFWSGDPTVASRNGTHFLASERLQGQSATEAKEQARGLLEVINGALAIHASAEPLVLGSRFIAPDGQEHQVVEVATARTRSIARSGTVVVDGVPQTPPPPVGPQIVELSDRNDHVRSALAVAGRERDLDWYDLYKLYELIRSDLGGVDGVAAAGLASKAEQGRFTGSANNPAVSGEASRHAVPSSSKPPKATMSLGAARKFMRRLLREWVAQHGIAL